MKAFLHSKEYTQEVSFLAWLCRIAKNEALDRLRKRRRIVPLDEEKINAVPDSSSPSRKADESLLLERVKSILSRRTILSSYSVSISASLQGNSPSALLDGRAARPALRQSDKKLRKTLGGK